jgi:hypothetical protein
MDYAHPPGGSMSAIVDGEFGFATIAHGGGWVPAVVTAGGVTSLSALLGDGVPASVRGLFEDWDGWCDRVVAAIAAADPGVSWQATDVAAFGPPLPDPSNLYLAGANYYDHVKEMGVDPPDKTTEDVFHFMVPSGSLTGTGHDVYRPAGVTQLDWEVEIAVVIGRPADSVAPESALEYDLRAPVPVREGSGDPDADGSGDRARQIRPGSDEPVAVHARERRDTAGVEHRADDLVDTGTDRLPERAGSAVGR